MVRGIKDNPTYNSFRQAQRRCTDPRTPSYSNYGGRGVQFLIPSWQALEAAIGPRPEGFTLDRVDSSGNYEIGNVKWSSPTEQNRNRRSVKCSMEQAREIREMYRRGQYPEDIANKLSVNIHTVEAILKNKQWREQKDGVIE